VAGFGLLATPESLASQSLWPRWCPPGLSFIGTSPLRRRPSCSLRSGGCSQPSDSSSRNPECFREHYRQFTPDSSVTGCGFSSAPESLASQCLLAAYLLRQGLIAGHFRCLAVFSPECDSSATRFSSRSLNLDEPVVQSYVRDNNTAN